MRQLLESIPHRRIEIGKQQQRNFRARPNLAGDVEHTSKRSSSFERPITRALDYRSIGDRIGERNAEFDQVGATPLERLDQRCRTVRMRIARREVRDESFAALASQAIEQLGDTGLAHPSRSFIFSRYM